MVQSSTTADGDVMKAISMLIVRLEKLSTEFRRATTHALSHVMYVTCGYATHNSDACPIATPAPE